MINLVLENVNCRTNTTSYLLNCGDRNMPYTDEKLNQLYHQRKIKTVRPNVIRIS